MAGNPHLSIIVSEHASSKEQYELFAKAIESILISLLKENGFFFQTVTHRVKDASSLIRKAKKGNYKRLSDIQDVAGCRVLFYLESDIEKFVSLLYEEFGRENIIKSDLKYSPDSYNAFHIVLKLNSERLKLTEYSPFKGLKCEIQLTTGLFHAWSEMAHNTIYKPQEELAGFDKDYFKSIEQEFSNIMKDHIKQASYTFEFVYMNMEHLRKGKQIFSLNFLKRIADLTSNNEIYENMKLLLNYVQKFGDKAPKELGIISLIRNVLDKSKKLKTEQIKSVFGSLRGMGYADVALLCIDILDELKYLHSKEVLRILIELSRSEEKSVREKSLKAIEDMAKYNFQVLQKIGYYSQDIILSEMESWDEKTLRNNLPIINTSLREILSSSFEGQSMTDYKTLSWQFGPLKSSETLDKIRLRAIVLLTKAYSLSENTPGKVEILKSMNEASHTPRQGNYDDKLSEMVVRTTNELIGFYITIVSKAENRIVKEIDEQTQWFKERFGDKDLKDVPNLEKLIIENDDYQIYRTFVGHGYRYKGIDNWQESDELRAKESKEYLKDFSEATYDKWKDIILRISKDPGLDQDMSEFHYFLQFLHEVGKQRSLLALKMLEENENDLERVIGSLFSGLWESENRDIFKKIIDERIKKSLHLPALSAMQIHFAPIDLGLIKDLLKAGIKESDSRTISNVIQAIVYNYDGSKEMKNIFLEGVIALTTLKNTDWVFRSSFKIEPVIKDLIEKEVKILLDNMLFSDHIDYHFEEALKSIAESFPEQVIMFFYSRVRIKLKKKNDRYDAIPYDFQQLNESLAPSAEKIIPIIFDWFKEKDWLFRWEASRLLHNIFPDFDARLEKMLIERIHEGGEINAHLILHVLDDYNGPISVHQVCKEFLKKFNDKKYKSDIMSILSKTGVVMGEYGLAEAYERKIEEIQSWKQDKEKEIVSFANEYEKYLKRRIAYERKKADEDIEIRKKTYGS